MYQEICLDEFHSDCEKRQSIIVSQDEKHDWKHIGYNDKNKRVRHFKIDGDVLPKGQQPERCDFLLLNDDDKDAYFIEIKGSPSELTKCISQIESTERMCSSSLKGYSKLYRLVLGTGHGTYGSKFIVWRDKKYKGTVEVRRKMIDDHF